MKILTCRRSRACITATAVGASSSNGVWNSSSRGKFSSVSIRALPAWLRGSNPARLSTSRAVSRSSGIRVTDSV